ncbi:MAG: hypothetical protein QF752_06125, partial [Planctomycetota bacterium]|nr:hypothetical protein [Planctomycetota bacterium]
TGKVGRPRGTGKKSSASNSPSYLILSGREFKTADRKGDLGGVIEKLIAAGHDLNKLSVYQRLSKVKIERRVSVSL